jgi:hypothetical protein
LFNISKEPKTGDKGKQEEEEREEEGEEEGMTLDNTQDSGIPKMGTVFDGRFFLDNEAEVVKFVSIFY